MDLTNAGFRAYRDQGIVSARFTPNLVEDAPDSKCIAFVPLDADVWPSVKAVALGAFGTLLQLEAFVGERAKRGKKTPLQDVACDVFACAWNATMHPKLPPKGGTETHGFRGKAGRLDFYLSDLPTAWAITEAGEDATLDCIVPFGMSREHAQWLLHSQGLFYAQNAFCDVDLALSYVFNLGLYGKRRQARG